MHANGTKKFFLSEVTQNQKAFTHKWILATKQRIMSLLSTILKKLSNKVNPKRNINRSPWEGEIDKIS